MGLGFGASDSWVHMLQGSKACRALGLGAHQLGFSIAQAAYNLRMMGWELGGVGSRMLQCMLMPNGFRAAHVVQRDVFR